MKPTSEQQSYIRRLLDSYRQTPGTSGRVRRADRELAAQLHRRGVALDVVDDAMLLAVARRTLRLSAAIPLNTIASLHYFLPVIDEILERPPDNDYLLYLRRKLDMPTRGTIK